MKNKQTWSSRFHFILATSGAAIGLGTVWAAPYTIGQNGGGGCLIMYIVLTLLIGLPILHLEISLGNHTKKNIIDGISAIRQEANISKHWDLIGFASALLLFCILSFYVIVGGQVLHHTYINLSNLIAPTNPQLGNGLIEYINAMIFSTLTFGLCVSSIRSGVEKCVALMMPALFIALVVMSIISTSLPGFAAATDFLFKINMDHFSLHTMLSAMGLSFFTLATGSGCMMNYGAYLQSTKKSIFPINLASTIMVIIGVCLSGLLVFTVTFSHKLAPTQGPDLVFKALPMAFSQFGSLQPLVGFVFFLLLAFAALTSSISLMEPLMRIADEHHGVPRRTSGFLIISLLAISSGLYTFNHLIFNHINLFALISNIVIEYLLPTLALCYVAFGINSKTPFTIFEHPVIKRYLHICIHFISPLALIILIGNKLWQ